MSSEEIEFLIRFAEFGLIANVLSIIPYIAVLSFRAQELTIRESREYVKFLVMFRSFAVQSHPLKRFCRMLLIFIPTYLVYINFISILYLLKYKGLFGMIRSKVSGETFSLIPIVKFEFVQVNQ